MRDLAALLSVLFATGTLLADAPQPGPAVQEASPGHWATTPDPDLPNVLILGDSISIGYSLQVREHLKGKANVFRPHKANGKSPENCQGTSLGVKEINRWLKGHTWDVIHFNWGLHDLKRVKQAGTSVNSTNPEDPYQASVEQYSKNLELLVGELKKTGATLIFATTTPVVEGSQGPLREADDPKRYNDAALEIMKAHKIAIDDLFTICEARLEEIQLPKNVHFNRAGNDLLAQAVACAIEKALVTE